MAIYSKLSCLWESSQALLKRDSITDPVTVIYSKRSEALLKTDFATPLKTDPITEFAIASVVAIHSKDMKLN